MSFRGPCLACTRSFYLALAPTFNQGWFSFFNGSTGISCGANHAGRMCLCSRKNRAQQPQAGKSQCLLLSPQVLGFLFFIAAYFLYKSPSVSSDGLEASLPSQSSASDSPTEQIQSNV